MGKLWSNTSERTQNGEKELRTALISRVLKFFSEKQLGRAIQKDVRNPIVAPQDYEVRQSGRVSELQNKDLWI